MNIISLGAGVQSSTVALMSTKGELPKPDCAIFADTGAEPKAVYAWLDWLEKQVSFPVYRVSSGNLHHDILRNTNTTGQRFAVVPWHIVKPNGQSAIGRRQCTAEYKIKPIIKKTRELVGLKPRQVCKTLKTYMWIGISTDEIQRMKESKYKYIQNVFPLIEKRMKRTDCIQWMHENGYPTPPRSSCVFCPFHNDSEWKNLKDNFPEDFAVAVNIDNVIRHQPKIKAQQFAHPKRIPLQEIDFLTLEEKGQFSMWQSFNNECEGMCGI